MTVRRLVRPALAGTLLAMGVTAFAGPAQGPRFVALDTLEPGLWRLREEGGEARAICLRDPINLLQLRNRGVPCSRFVIENSATAASIHYTCPGSGHGRTTVSVETPRLAQIESDGIEGGAPFALTIEARRAGDCPTR